MKRVVIIGGGFAGSYLAKKLQNDFEVVLIDTKDYFEFTPGVLRVMVEPEHIKKIQVPHKSYLKKGEAIIETVTDITKIMVKIKGKKVKFDYLVICSGSTYKTPIKEMNVVITARAKHLKDCYYDLHKAKNVLIIGGGLVGVELAGEICWKYPDKDVTIVQAEDKILERNNKRTIDYAIKFLQKHGVKIILNEMVIKNKGKVYITNKGRKIRCDMTFLCTGIKPNFSFMKRHFSKNLNERNLIRVNDALQLTGCKNIFAAGDITDRTVEKTAQNAQRQASVVAYNLKALEKNKPLKRYESKQTPMVISLGKYGGIFTYKKFAFGGFIPAFMKAMIEKIEMWRRKF